jgi:ribosome recycling factor
MNKEDQIFDLLERLYIELQDTKKELKEDISNVRTELKEEISNVRIELKEDIKILNDNQMILFDKLEKIGSDVEIIKEDLVDIQSITASNYRDIIRLKAVK